MVKRKKTKLNVRGLDKKSPYSEDYEKFISNVSARLKKLRLERNLTIEDLAEYELSVRQIKRILNGEVKNFTMAYLYKLSKALKVKPVEIVDVIT